MSTSTTSCCCNCDYGLNTINSLDLINYLVGKNQETPLINTMQSKIQKIEMTVINTFQLGGRKNLIQIKYHQMSLQ
jgi:hypothetical protein